MRLKEHPIYEAIILLALSILWCEIGYYYYVFLYGCAGWPAAQNIETDDDLRRILIIADTHIMGPLKSARLDKIRREWQMQQAFRISNKIFNPEVIIFLGDILDEGSFSRDDTFDKACQEFDTIFAYNEGKQERIIIPGNHDIGFHDEMIYFPYLKRRFIDRYQIEPRIDLVNSTKINKLNMVVMNSMSFFGDGCPACSLSVASTNRLAERLQKLRSNNPEEYSVPILLTHIPLYRNNDTNCIYPNSIKERVKEGNVEGKDVLHKKVSQFLLKKIQPRLVLSGHTHMDCVTEHTIDEKSTSITKELTVTSYNHKYAEAKPGFLLLMANSTHVFTRHCNLVEEWIIVSVYMATILIISFRLVLANRSRTPIREMLIHNE